MSNMLVSLYSLYNVDYMYIKIFVYMCCIMSNFMIACVLLNISKNNSGLKGLTQIVTRASEIYAIVLARVLEVLVTFQCRQNPRPHSIHCHV